MEKVKTLARYLYHYKLYGVYLYMAIYWFRKTKINLRGYGTFYLRHKSFDAEIFNQMFIYRQYDYTIKGEPKVIIDLGGNNGMSAVFFHKKYPTASIYVLEPDKNNFEVLKKNTASINEIIPINKAIWTNDGYINLSSGESWAIKVDMESGKNVAEAITMASLISTYDIKQIDLIKMDIETAEKEIFESNTDFLKITRNLFVELHDWIRPGCAQSFFRAIYNYDYHFMISEENTFITDLQVKSTTNAS